MKIFKTSMICAVLVLLIAMIGALISAPEEYQFGARLDSEIEEAIRVADPQRMSKALSNWQIAYRELEVPSQFDSVRDQIRELSSQLHQAIGCVDVESRAISVDAARSALKRVPLIGEEVLVAVRGGWFVRYLWRVFCALGAIFFAVLYLLLLIALLVRAVSKIVVTSGGSNWVPSPPFSPKSGPYGPCGMPGMYGLPPSSHYGGSSGFYQ